MKDRSKGVGRFEVRLKTKAKDSDKSPWVEAVLHLHDKALRISHVNSPSIPLCPHLSPSSFRILSEDFLRQETILGILNGKKVSLYRMQFPTLSSMLQWKREVAESLQPVWDSESVKQCRVCNTDFSAFRRQHHCRLCGKAVCGDCSPYRGRVPWGGDRGKERLCRGCVGTLGSLKAVQMEGKQGT